MADRKRQVRGGRKNGGGRRKVKPPAAAPSRRKQNQSDRKLSSVPVAQGSKVRTARPSVRTMPNGDALVKHREYISDIVGANSNPSDFFAVPFAINPGQAATFPWLSRVAQNYESYSFESLAFSYETMSKTTLNGTVMLTVDYDAQDAPPADKVSAASYRSTVRCAPWQNVRHISKAEDLHKSKTNWIRSGVPPIGTDIKLYDIGNLFVITENLDVKEAVCGELYVEYVVKLMTPVYETPATSSVAGGSVLHNGAKTPANPFGDGFAHLSPNSYGLAMGNDSILTFAFPGSYIVTALFVGTVLTNCDATPVDARAIVVGFGQVTNGTSTNTERPFAVRIVAPGGSIQFSAGTSTSITQAFAWVGMAPQGSLV